MIALDTNVIIYVFGDDPVFGRKARVLLEGMAKEQASASTLLITEALALSSQRPGTPSVRQLEQALLAIKGLTYIDVTPAIALEAAELIRGRGSSLKTVDAVHLVSARSAGARQFWTNDKQLAKVSIKGVTIKSLSSI